MRHPLHPTTIRHKTNLTPRAPHACQHLPRRLGPNHHQVPLGTELRKDEIGLDVLPINPGRVGRERRAKGNHPPRPRVEFPAVAPGREPPSGVLDLLRRAGEGVVEPFVESRAPLGLRRGGEGEEAEAQAFHLGRGRDEEDVFDEGDEFGFPDKRGGGGGRGRVEGGGGLGRARHVAVPAPTCALLLLDGGRGSRRGRARGSDARWTVFDESAPGAEDVLPSRRADAAEAFPEPPDGGEDLLVGFACADEAGAAVEDEVFEVQVQAEEEGEAGVGDEVGC